MKVCMMTSVYALGEEDRNGSFLVECNRYMTERGYRVEVFAPSYEGRENHSVQGVPVYRFRYFFKRFENLTHFQGAPNRIRNPLYLFVAGFYILSGLVQAIGFCRRGNYDVIHVHWPFPHGIWGYFAAMAHRTPIVLTFHGAELLLSKKFPFVAYFIRHAVRHAQALICNSNYTAGQLAALTGVPVASIHVIPFGATVEIKPVEKNRAKPVKDVLYVGRLIERKGVGYLLNAWPDIVKHTQARLHIVGDGDKAAEWKALAQTLGIEASVSFHGVVTNEQLEQLYREADVFVLPSIVDSRGDTEGLGIVLVEALAYLTPVVACDVGGISDVIRDGETGLLVPQRDAKALTDAVLKVLENPELAERLVNAGAAHARTYFDWRRIIDALSNVYGSVTREKS
ncbi:glycosyltransferase family 4 protein [Methylomonas sp. MED-D]|uniref:glycosyltransferase family 4 protein n=1 Tax=unclassified Methylomonas TaxID=2608980 RepID=UPI0028A4DB30|nr:glycosyltransferase family 4 protein [Methylomonas sp. MV1]MDT4332542.1 glycosyltransferase family 4 protein [Methylomonas sp. MV1]